MPETSTKKNPIPGGRGGWRNGGRPLGARDRLPREKKGYKTTNYERVRQIVNEAASSQFLRLDEETNKDPIKVLFAIAGSNSVDLRTRAYCCKELIPLLPPLIPTNPEDMSDEELNGVIERLRAKGVYESIYRESDAKLRAMIEDGRVGEAVAIEIRNIYVSEMAPAWQPLAPRPVGLITHQPTDDGQQDDEVV
jgi:hypothetical protein